ncbi:MAG: hypothetical protein GY711_33875 [bacterium]|nr:hypothetical protein [bacterium]
MHPLRLAIALLPALTSSAHAQWSSATLSSERAAVAAAAHGRFAVFAGGAGKQGTTDAVDVYDAYSDTWTSTTLVEGRTATAVTVLNERLFLAGGQAFCCCTSCFYSSSVDIFTDVGTPYCSSAPSSLGIPARISTSGSTSLAANDLGLLALDLPPNRFGYMLAGQTQGFVSGPGGARRPRGRDLELPMLVPGREPGSDEQLHRRRVGPVPLSANKSTG